MSFKPSIQAIVLVIAFCQCKPPATENTNLTNVNSGANLSSKGMARRASLMATRENLNQEAKLLMESYCWKIFNSLSGFSNDQKLALGGGSSGCLLAGDAGQNSGYQSYALTGNEGNSTIRSTGKAVFNQIKKQVGDAIGRIGHEFYYLGTKKLGSLAGYGIKTNVTVPHWFVKLGGGIEAILFPIENAMPFPNHLNGEGDIIQYLRNNFKIHLFGFFEGGLGLGAGGLRIGLGVTKSVYCDPSSYVGGFLRLSIGGNTISQGINIGGLAGGLADLKNKKLTGENFLQPFKNAFRKCGSLSVETDVLQPNRIRETFRTLALFASAKVGGTIAGGGLNSQAMGSLIGAATESVLIRKHIVSHGVYASYSHYFDFGEISLKTMLDTDVDVLLDRQTASQTKGHYLTQGRPDSNSQNQLKEVANVLAAFNRVSNAMLQNPESIEIGTVCQANSTKQCGLGQPQTRP